MSETRIEWADAVWNPVTGCTKVSPGCVHCYAERMAKRLAGRFGYPRDAPFRVTLHPNRLEEPLQWSKPRRIFVVSMGDLFHEDVPDQYIDRVFSTMALAQMHTFLILTKRPDRMLEWFQRPVEQTEAPLIYWRDRPDSWPLPNVWVGTSAENQKTADQRIPHLLQVPAVVRFLSCEPLLGPLNLMRINLGLKQTNSYGQRRIEWNSLTGWEHQYSPDADDRTLPRASVSNQTRTVHWVIAGGESGPAARPMDENWIRSLRDQCLSAGVAFFYKQRVVVGRKEALPPLDGRKWNQVP